MKDKKIKKITDARAKAEALLLFSRNVDNLINMDDRLQDFDMDDKEKIINFVDIIAKELESRSRKLSKAIDIIDGVNNEK